MDFHRLGLQSSNIYQVASLKTLYFVSPSLNLERTCFCVLPNIRTLNMNLLTEFVKQKRLEGSCYPEFLNSKYDMMDKITSENKEVSYEHILTLMCQSLQGRMQSVVVFFNE